MSAERIPVVVLGAGPAGLGAALRLARRGDCAVTLLERNGTVGGNAGSFELDGLRVDYGSHRLHPACSERVLEDILSLLGRDVLRRRRHGRIRLRKRWVRFPLKPLNLLLSIPPSFLLGVLRDATFKRNGRNGHSSFATELENRLGGTICRDFYFPYAQKIWGLPADELDAEQARRRVSANSFGKIIRKVMAAVPGLGSPTSGIFYYPRNGFGQISEAYHLAGVEAGVDVRLRTTVSEIQIEQNRAVAVRAESDGAVQELPAHLVLSTIPLTRLIRTTSPAPPQEILASASGLKYRAMILVYLVLEGDQFTEYDAHYFPDSDVSITRLSEPKNYGLAKLPGTTVLCAELPCSVDDHLWNLADDELGSLVMEDLNRVGLPCRMPVRRVSVRRLPQAYPVYTRKYREHFDRLDQWIKKIGGLVSLGRQGLFAHDNTHHTLEMAYAACECVTSGGEFDSQRWAQYRKEFESHVVED